MGPSVAFGGAAWQLCRNRTLDPTKSRLLLLYLLAGIGSLFAELHASDVGHLAYASPLMLILLIHSFRYAWGIAHRLRPPLAAAIAVSTLLLTLTAYGRVSRATLFNVPVSTRRGVLYMQEENAVKMRMWIKAVETAVPPNHETFLFPYSPEIYFLTMTRNPTRYDVLLRTFHSPGQIGEAIRTLTLRPPRYVFSIQTIRRGLDPVLYYAFPDVIKVHPVEDTVLNAHGPYRLVGQVDGLKEWVLDR